jgi:penicillin-binding protein 2
MSKTVKYDASKIAERLRDHSLYIAFAPADKPRIALAVIVENSGFGAAAAAPIARLAIDYYLLGKRPEEPVAKVEVSPDAQSAQSRADANKPENKKPEANKPEANKPEANKPEANKPESGKPELQKADPTKPEAQPNKPEVKKSEASKPPSAPAPANATGVAKTNAQRSAP